MPELIPNPDLYKRIINEVNYQQELLKLKRRLFSYAVVLISSSFVFGIVIQEFLQQMYKSGFVQISSLLLSDFNIVTAHFRDYLLSLVESLPVMGIALVALALLLVLFSAVKFFRYIFAIKKLGAH